MLSRHVPLAIVIAFIGFLLLTARSWGQEEDDKATKGLVERVRELEDKVRRLESDVTESKIGIADAWVFALPRNPGVSGVVPNWNPKNDEVPHSDSGFCIKRIVREAQGEYRVELDRKSDGQKDLVIATTVFGHTVRVSNNGTSINLKISNAEGQPVDDNFFLLLYCSND